MKNILIPISLWETASRVAGQGVKIAEAFHSTVRLLHIVRTPANMARWPEELKEQRVKEIELLGQELQDKADEFARPGVVIIPEVVEAGGVVITILEKAEEIDADLIVMGSHGRGALFGAILGDVTRDVLRGSTCPVMVVPTVQKRDPDDVPDLDS